ncbi:50S ribosomal protein L18 [Candidatus Nomurabacteria bacterium]|nr:50S ribosomal protein L18 [Candidatus Nomurabacteria bacterium]
MNKVKNQKTAKREVRHKRIRAKVFGTKARPRLSIFKSNKAMYAQLIDDEKGTTLVSANSTKVKGKNMTEKALEVGKHLAKTAIEKKIKKVVFDRGGYIFTGKVKALADGAREGGLDF